MIQHQSAFSSDMRTYEYQQGQGIDITFWAFAISEIHDLSYYEDPMMILGEVFSKKFWQSYFNVSNPIPSVLYGYLLLKSEVRGCHGIVMKLNSFYISKELIAWQWVRMNSLESCFSLRCRWIFWLKIVAFKLDIKKNLTLSKSDKTSKPDLAGSSGLQKEKWSRL